MSEWKLTCLKWGNINYVNGNYKCMPPPLPSRMLNISKVVHFDIRVDIPVSTKRAHCSRLSVSASQWVNILACYIYWCTMLFSLDQYSCFHINIRLLVWRWRLSGVRHWILAEVRRFGCTCCLHLQHIRISVTAVETSNLTCIGLFKLIVFLSTPLN
jgi:hypothetical protein